MINLRELKSRKAKFGFDYGQLSIQDVINLAEFLNLMYTTYTPADYMIEEGGYNRPAVKIYTDNEETAKWIRLNAHIT